MIANMQLDGLTVDGETRPTQCVFVTGNFFSVLGIRPFLTSSIHSALEGAVSGADPVVVLSYLATGSLVSAAVQTSWEKGIRQLGHPRDD